MEEKQETPKVSPELSQITPKVETKPSKLLKSKKLRLLGITLLTIIFLLITVSLINKSQQLRQQPVQLQTSQFAWENSICGNGICEPCENECCNVPCQTDKRGQEYCPPPSCEGYCPQDCKTTSNWKTYRNEEYRFEIKYPNNLIIDYNYIGPDPTGYDQAIQISNVEIPFGLVCYYESGEDPCKENIAVYIRVSDLDSRNETFQESISHTYPKQIPPQRPVLIGNNNFIQIGSPNHYYLEKQRIVYEFALESGDAVKDESKKIYNQILSTFRFLD